MLTLPSGVKVTVASALRMVTPPAGDRLSTVIPPAVFLTVVFLSTLFKSMLWVSSLVSSLTPAFMASSSSSSSNRLPRREDTASTLGMPSLETRLSTLSLVGLFTPLYSPPRT